MSLVITFGRGCNSRQLQTSLLSGASSGYVCFRKLQQACPCSRIAKSVRRSFSEGRTGLKIETKMFYVYIIQSINYSNQHYVGFSDDLKTRIRDHNWGNSIHTSKFKPWELICYFGFKDRVKAKQFEHYLKTGSGRAFLKKHFL